MTATSESMSDLIEVYLDVLVEADVAFAFSLWGRPAGLCREGAMDRDYDVDDRDIGIDVELDVHDRDVLVRDGDLCGAVLDVDLEGLDDLPEFISGDRLGAHLRSDWHDVEAAAAATAAADGRSCGVDEAGVVV